MNPAFSPILGFLLKVFGLSLAIALAIKTLGPQIPISPTVAVSLGIVLLPTVAMAALLIWQWGRPRSL